MQRSHFNLQSQKNNIMSGLCSVKQNKKKSFVFVQRSMASINIHIIWH